MPLGTFKNTSKAYIPATKFDVDDNLNHPLIVIVREYNPSFSTEAYPQERPVVFVMIADLEPVKTGGKAVLYANALLGGSAVADRLKGYAGAEDEAGLPVQLPVKLGKTRSEKTGRKYQTIEALSGKEAELAAAWYEANKTALVDERDRMQAEVDAAAEAEQDSISSNDRAPQPGTSDDALNAAIAAMKG